MRRHEMPAILAFCISLTGLLNGCSSDQSSAKDKTKSTAQQDAPVVVADVVRKTIPIRVEGIGNVESISTVAIKSRVDGQILKVGFHDGAEVVRGQVLFELDARPAVAQLKQVQSKLASDKAQRQRAREQDNRYKDLLQKQFISSDAYAQYKTALESAEAGVEADHAAVESSQLQIEFATIRAPISGRVGKVMIPQGNLVRASDTNPLVIINQLAPIYVVFAVPEQELAQLRAAQRAGPVAVEIDAVTGNGEVTRAAGALAFIDNVVDSSTGTIKLRAIIPNKHAELWPGQFVTATAILGEQRNATVVPFEALQIGPEGPYVFIVDVSGRAQLRKVVVDRTAGRETIIAKGLEIGEKVVVDGQSRLLPGLAVVEKTSVPQGK